MTIPIIAIIITLIAAPLIYNHMSKYFDHSLVGFKLGFPIE